ncbi:MAG: SDR family NAD(P)-dependent oxidoreductase [Myxococcota bacterium]|nr:SDR family NAD(P)-dependent oxidoreductase [Myxococcota bacterium]
MTFRIADAVDALLEAPVAPSFTRIGYDVRSLLERWKPLASYDLRGRVMLLTGATSGLGLAAAEALARAGATLLLLGRDAAKTERVRADLARRTHNDRLSAVIADMGDLAAVRRAADEVLASHDVLHVLAHNAGALHATRRNAPDGTEETVASQVLGPFLLTGLLMARLRASAPARVLTMSSGGMYATGLTVDDLEMSDDYSGTEQYARAKRAQVTLNEMWAERFAASGVVFHALHPGWALTPGVETSLPTFRRIVGPLLRSPEQGADTLVWLAADDGEPLATNGRFWLDRRVRAIHKLPTTRRTDTAERRAALWEWCVKRTGLDPAVSSRGTPADPR